MKPKGVLISEAIPRSFDATALSTMKLVDVARALDSATFRPNMNPTAVRQLLTRIMAATTTSALGVLGRPEQLRLVRHLNRSLDRIVDRLNLGESLSEGYYRESKPSLQSVIDRWQKDGDKLYDDAQPVMIPVRDLWPFREYTWTRNDARVSQEEWDKLKASLRTAGWKRGEPLYFEVGRSGGAKVGEGNHRLSISKAAHVREVPVRFVFKSGAVRKDPQRRSPAPRPRPPAPKPSTPARSGPLSPEDEQRIQDILDLL